MRTWGPWCAGALVLSSAAAVHADTCPVPDGGNAKLEQIDARERIHFLHRTVDAQAGYARTWKWAWFGIGSATFASSVGEVIGWATTNEKTREANIVDNLVVSGFSIVTPVTALLFSLRVEKDAPAIDELLRETNGGEAGTCMVLARMEELVKLDAAEEDFNTGFFAQAAAIIGLGAMFSIMAVEAATASDPDIRDAHWINALTNTGVGLILTEAQIFTTPTGASTAYSRYLKGDLPRPKLTVSIVPLVATPGAALRVSF